MIFSVLEWYLTHIGRFICQFSRHNNKNIAPRLGFLIEYVAENIVICLFSDYQLLDRTQRNW